MSEVRCPNCRASNDAGARFCGECGQRLTSLSPRIGSPAEAGARSRRSCLLLVGAAAMVLVCGGCVLFFLLADSFNLEGLLDEVDAPFATEPAAAFTGFYDVWLEHNVAFEGENYMVAHLEFEVEQALAQEVLVSGLVWQADGSPMDPLEPEYTVQGQAGVTDYGQVEFSPTTYWENYQLWIPYSALYIGDGYTMSITLEAVSSGQELAAWQTETFDVE